MIMLKQEKLKRIILFSVLSLVGICLVAVTLSGASNLRLPSHSPVTDRLSENEKARLTEAGNLRLKLGESIWPGWSQTLTPFLVYNEAYAFLVDLPDPTPGWTFALGRQMGSSWEVVPEDTFNDQVYYRQRLANPNENPQNFIARVGDTWSATMQTNEYAEIAFYQGFHDELPPGIREIAPYRLMWRFLGGDMDGLVAGLEHESFHVLQANQAFNHLKSAEAINHLEDTYPFTDSHLNQMWQNEMDLLVRAVRAPSLSEAKILATQWTAARQARRSQLSENLIGYERQREWLEGLAKYAELNITKTAANPGYQPLPAVLSINNFHHYKNRPQFWEMQLDEARRIPPYPSEVRFYYSGFAQAALLDRLYPNWKKSAMQDNAFLEDLLKN